MERVVRDALLQPLNMRFFGQHHRGWLQRAQTGARWKNSCSAPAAARIGQAEIATIITKNSASRANSKLFSLAK
jgi:hypothetical protein